MKNFILTILIILFVVFGEVFTQTIVNTLMQKEGDEEFKKSREEWLRSLHRCEEDLPYWIIDLKTKEGIWNELGKYKNDLPISNSYAEGRIIGEWIEKGSDNLAGRVHTLDLDTNTNEIFLASAGGNIWKGTAKGNDWSCLNNGKKFANPRMVKLLRVGGKRRILVAANSPSAVYFTDDDGNIWKKAKGFENAEKWGWIIRAAVTTSQDIYVLLVEWDFNAWKSKISLYKSTNNGESFTLVRTIFFDYNNSNLCDIWAPRYDVNILYFAVKDTLFSTDQSNKFEIVSINSFIDQYTSGVILRGATVGNQVHIYFAKLHTNVQTYFYYSSDGGKTFSQVGKLDFYPFEKNSFEVSQTNNNIIYFGQVEFYRSSNLGSTWTKANKWDEYYGNMSNKLHADIPGIVSYRKSNGGEILFVCTDGGLYVSYDQGKSFTNLSLKNLNISQYYSVYTFKITGNILFAGSQDQGFQVCLDDSGKVLSFKQVISGDYGHLSSSDGGMSLWTTYPGFALLFLNLYQKNFTSYTWNFQGTGFLWLPPVYADPDNPLQAYLISGNGEQPSGTPASYIYKLYLDNSTKKIQYELLPFNFALDNVTRKISALAISPISHNFWFAMTNDGKFFRSTDKGFNWTLIDNIAGPQSHYFYGNKILPSNLNLGKIVIAGSGYSNPGVLISYDTGRTFTPLGTNLPSTLFYDIEYNQDESLIFAATELGPFVYHFPERRWFYLGGGNCPDNIFWDVEYLPTNNTVRYATYGRGIWDFKIENVLKIAENQPKQPNRLDLNVKQLSIPNEFFIEINCEPNDYLLVEVYDIEGRQLKTLFNGYTSTGNVQLYWNGDTDNGKPLPSGKYFIIANRKFETKNASVIISK